MALQCRLQFTKGNGKQMSFQFRFKCSRELLSRTDTGRKIHEDGAE